ncbi:sugar ABC transporter substrate-binding protein [Bacillus sp. FJAT-27251]|uniref:ABC transporter substrate-binding protein n=1 Tax=Bacillus sp. FJAT-27251 TaxID=1684142 RepID=UPI0006A7DE16|nr:sugar ABC transporter substrate-binding protein [Bacillus sp. FJAT-27251]
MKALLQRFMNIQSLSILLLIFILSGCAGSSEESSASGEPGKESGKTTIEFVYWAAAGGEEKGFNDLVAKFEEENPDIKVKKSQVPPPNQGDYYTKLQTRMGGNDAPDVFRVQYQKIGEFASKGALLDITETMGKDKSNFNPSLLTAVTFKDKIFGLPHHTDTLAVFYNKTYLDELGIKAPEALEDAWTWEELADVAKQIKEKGLAPNGLASNTTASSAYRTLPFFFQNGASLLTEDLKKANVTTPEAIETLTFLQDTYKNYMSKGNSMKGSDDATMLFTSGNAGLLINGNWMIPKFESDMKDYEWGVTYMPAKKTAASDLGGNGLAIPANSKQAEAAKKFVAFMGEKENMKTFVEQGLFLPSRTDITGPFEYEIEDPGMMELFIEQSQTVPEELAQTVTTPEFSKINQALGDSIEELYTQGKTPEQVAKELEAKINSILEP